MKISEKTQLAHSRLEQRIERTFQSIEREYSTKKATWRGAHVSVSPSNEQVAGGHSEYVVVVTEHSKALVWLLYRLKGVYKEYLSAVNKYEFYGQVGQSANRYLQQHEAVDEQQLLLSCLQTAKEFFEKNVRERRGIS